MSAQPHGGVAPDVRPLRIVAAVFGVVFLVVGVLGFVPGATTDVDTLTFAGPHGDAQLLGIFHVSVLHNIVHLLFGVAGLAAASRAQWAFGYLVGGGVIYAVLAVYGLFVHHDSDANFVPLNTADNWLHTGLAVAMIVLGLLLRPKARRDTLR